MSRKSTELGLGLIGIGKPWGHAPRPVPAEAEARELIEFAYELGIRYFDTAPSYGDGVSEERLGKCVRALPEAAIATKMGEHWNREKNEPYADHSFDALRRSLDRSMERLGRIDILQLHKTTPAALLSADVSRAWEHARSLGITRIGPSASDLESAAMAVADERYTVMQVPYNLSDSKFGSVVDAAVARGMWVAVNRPFTMGALTEKSEAMRFVLDRRPSVVLSGTVSREHLRENWDLFRELSAISSHQSA